MVLILLCYILNFLLNKAACKITRMYIKDKLNQSYWCWNIVLNSPIEETKYLSLHQHTISDSILEEDDVPLRNFYQKNLDNIQTSKTLDEESKNNKEIKEEDLSRYPSKIEDGLFEKIDKIVNDESIEWIQHPKFMDDDIEINDNTFVFPNLDSARLKRNRLQPLKKEFFCTQKTELELTPQGIKGWLFAIYLFKIWFM